MAARAGWLVEAAGPLTDAELEQSREAATRTGLFLESCRAPEATATRPTVATAIGLLTGLGILAMTVGLLRSEAAGDLRTLTATGGHRAGCAGRSPPPPQPHWRSSGRCWARLAPTRRSSPPTAHLAPLGQVPVVHLAFIPVGLPVAAAVAGWVLAGREPPALTRQPT
jgi:putative ABC transport system permease protein